MEKVPGGKIPYSISMNDDSPFVFAGLWEGWKERRMVAYLHHHHWRTE
jgi:putative SOS response-associated peptidase YedK